MHFRIKGLSAEQFQPLFGLPEMELERLGIKRYVVDKQPGFPDRVALTDADIGETVLLLNHVCQPAQNAYRASHAIFVREGPGKTFDAINQVPESLRLRLLSLRAYDKDHMMIDADLVEGTSIETLIEKLFANELVSYIHVHNARRGCYAARIDRA